jgi:hypothetical protein
MEKIVELDEAQLIAKLTRLLETWPLYRQLKWTGARGKLLPEKISYYCTQCTKQQVWQVQRNQVTHDFGVHIRQYRCLNCNAQIISFACSWTESKTEPGNGGTLLGTFLKIGQWPALEERSDAELEKALESSDDLEFYKTAIRLRNFNSGIGAMAYMRRIIENHMNDMLDILGEGSTSDEKFKELRKARFEDKLTAAAGLFPKHLIPADSPNPFTPLYKLTSEAIHGLSESDSVALVDDCRLVFEYVFSQIRPHLRKEQEFRTGLQRLAKRAAVGNETNA